MDRYIKSKPHFINIKKRELSMLGDDPLGEVFGLRSIHRLQMPGLLREQLQATHFRAGSSPQPDIEQIFPDPPRNPQPGDKRKTPPSKEDHEDLDPL